MKNPLSNPRRILAAVFLLGAVDAATAAVVVTFSGQVTDVGGFFGATPPPGVSVGNNVSGTVRYSTAAATVVEVGPSEREYVFPQGSGNEVTIIIGTNVWKADLQSVSLCDDACGGDYLDYIGASLVTATFPGNLGSGVLGLDYSDSETPYDLLNGHDLPNASEGGAGEGRQRVVERRGERLGDPVRRGLPDRAGAGPDLGRNQSALRPTLRGKASLQMHKGHAPGPPRKR